MGKYKTVANVFTPANNFELYRRQYHEGVSKSRQGVFPCFEIFLMDIESIKTKKKFVQAIKALPPAEMIQDSQLGAYIKHIPRFDETTLLAMSMNNHTYQMSNPDKSKLDQVERLLATFETIFTSDSSNTQLESHADSPKPRTKASKLVQTGLSTLRSGSPSTSKKSPDSAKVEDSTKVGYVNKYGYTLLCKYSDLQADTGHRVKIGGKQVAIFLVGGETYLMDNKCTHADVPLAPGDIEEYKGEPSVVCPGHGLKFNLKTGACNAKKYSQPVYASKVKSGYVWGKFNK